MPKNSIPGFARTVMNTTPSTSKNALPTYRMTGGQGLSKLEIKPHFIAVLILRRGGVLFDPAFIRDVMEINPAQVILVNGPAQRLPDEELLNEYPRLQFLSVREEQSTGVLLNIAVRESRCPWVLAVWDDLTFLKNLWSEPIMYRLTQKEVLCRVPVMKNVNGALLPSISVPAFRKNRFYTIEFVPSTEEDWTLFPSDFIGMYNKRLFIQSGGFDADIDNGYYQVRDFGIRAWLWGEKILCDNNLMFTYSVETPSEDSTPDRYYGLYYLKNLAVKHLQDHGSLGVSSFLRYALFSGRGWFEAYTDYKKAKSWVNANKYRFKISIRELSACWNLNDRD